MIADELYPGTAEPPVPAHIAFCLDVQEATQRLVRAIMGSDPDAEVDATVELGALLGAPAASISIAAALRDMLAPEGE